MPILPESRLKRHEGLVGCFGLLLIEANTDPKKANMLPAARIRFSEQCAKGFSCRGGVEAFFRRPGEVGKLDLDESLADPAMSSFSRQIIQEVGDEQV